MLNNNIKNEKNQVKILKDINKKTNKETKWKKYKQNNLLIAYIYYKIFNDLNTKSKRLISCGAHLIFKEFADNTLKLFKARFCKLRLCSMCAWRRSLKVYGQVSKVIDYLDLKNKYSYAFLTLTVKNCSKDDLSKTIDDMFYSFKKLTANKNFKTSVEGFFRALEVTYNAETDTYHPHFHCILIVLKSYFTSRDYIKQKDWVNMWQKASKLDYAPVVDIRKVNALTYKTVAEVSKYTVKTNDLFIYDENNNLDELKTMEVVETLDNALARRRLFSFGGVAKEAHKLLNLEDLNDTDLINIDGEEEIREDIFKLLEFTWSNKHKNYIFNSYVDK